MNSTSSLRRMSRRGWNNKTGWERLGRERRPSFIVQGREKPRPLAVWERVNSAMAVVLCPNRRAWLEVERVRERRMWRVRMLIMSDWEAWEGGREERRVGKVGTGDGGRDRAERKEGQSIEGRVREDDREWERKVNVG